MIYRPHAKYSLKGLELKTHPSERNYHQHSGLTLKESHHETCSFPCSILDLCRESMVLHQYAIEPVPKITPGSCQWHVVATSHIKRCDTPSHLFFQFFATRNLQFAHSTPTAPYHTNTWYLSVFPTIPSSCFLSKSTPDQIYIIHHPFWHKNMLFKSHVFKVWVLHIFWLIINDSVMLLSL